MGQERSGGFHVGSFPLLTSSCCCLATQLPSAWSQAGCRNGRGDFWGGLGASSPTWVRLGAPSCPCGSSAWRLSLALRGSSRGGRLCIPGRWRGTLGGRHGAEGGLLASSLLPLQLQGLGHPSPLWSRRAHLQASGCGCSPEMEGTPSAPEHSHVQPCHHFHSRQFLVKRSGCGEQGDGRAWGRS